CAKGAVRRLNLKGVALRLDCIEVDALEHIAAIALEASGEVAHRHAEQDARVPRAAGRDETPQQSPVPDTAALDVARAEHDVRVGRGRYQSRNVVRIMGEVAVHLEHEVCAGAERAAEAGEIRGAEPLLAL